MARRFGFKPTLKETMRQNIAAQRFMALAAPDEKREYAAAHIASMDGVDIDAVHRKQRAAPRQLEAPVVQAVRQLVAHHPLILWILRMNAGQASYEAKSGKWAPVKFHEWIRSPIPCRMSDFYGMLIDGRTIALEIKKPGWVRPTDQREREQADFLQVIRAHGGVAAFITDAMQVAELLK